MMISFIRIVICVCIIIIVIINLIIIIIITPGLHHEISVFSDPDPGKS